MADKRTRRHFLVSTGAAGTAAAGLAGCIGGGPGSAQGSSDSTNGSTEQLTIAYVPIYPNMQHYVMREGGYYDALPSEVVIERFSDGPSVVKAFASDAVDIAMFGITPAMVLVSKGKKASVLVANSRNGFRVLATDGLTNLYLNERKGVFSTFEEQYGRKVKVGVPPDGSVPDVVLRYWIERELELGELESVVDKVKISPAKAPQTIQAGEIDATMIQEPFATVIASIQGVSEVAWSGDILPDHPVTAAFVHDRVASDIAEGFVEQHTKATQFVRENPGKAAEDAAAVIGSGVSTELAQQAIDSQASDFLSNPHRVKEQAATMARFVEEVGNTSSVVSPNQLFDFTVYDAVAGQ
jgi:NitT/TauT family transport system substrate-binding protein